MWKEEGIRVKKRLNSLVTGLSGERCGGYNRVHERSKKCILDPQSSFSLPFRSRPKGIDQELKLTQKIFAAFAEGIWRPAKGSPLKAIRELIVDSTEGDDNSGSGSRRDVYIGDVDFRHAHCDWWTERLTPIKNNWEKWKEKEKFWSIGAVLKLSYHNRSIGFAAISTLFHQWGIAQIGCTEVRAETNVSNIESNHL
ncbi:hypothetical protein BT96DRAFT_972801 [Gymnopus androsaceus JB14]|uniref:N-acetyltransferase domain-containing protein n=1 Tax=Gymnopus androsaceus JB14 TaxID=1447944 RepID=A0A6A4I6D3_9AGAR|nr:hypothetical protein BT96DRAFT_972801 [Gymnopus androsaceus JB14]